MNMMGINKAFVRATRKTAALIARVQRAAKRGRNTATLIADIQRFAALILDD